MSDAASQSEDGGDGEIDRDRLILDHMPLLHHIVGRMSWDVPGRVEREDLLGFGMLGLIAAADSWDKERHWSIPTTTYAIAIRAKALIHTPFGATSSAGKML